MTHGLCYYVILIIIVGPVLVCAVIHTIIFRTIRASFRRIQPNSERTTTTRLTNERSKMTRRDVHLLRHMIIMLAVFVGGWGPVYITLVLMSYLPIDPRLLKSFALLADISLIFDIIDLFFYSQKMRRYLQRMILLRCCA